MTQRSYNQDDIQRRELARVEKRIAALQAQLERVDERIDKVRPLVAKRQELVNALAILVEERGFIMLQIVDEDVSPAAQYQDRREDELDRLAGY